LRHQQAGSRKRVAGSGKASPAASVLGRFDLTVDSIMRGPDLVGWAPTALR
jgi:hypothetical protein